MKMRTVLLALIMLIAGTGFSQAKRAAVQKKQAKYPETFIISKSDYDNLFKLESGAIVKTPNNKYLDKSVLELNTRNGDMQLLRIKLNYFPKAILMIQVNGVYSTQVFITSADKNLSYKGKIDAEKISLLKCHRDDIFVE